ncbi:MAG: hypothetical protein JNK04_14830, partial [Myxococcales bacterium]|nr:hypothetical protein [Myxococcales bacterium]
MLDLLLFRLLRDGETNDARLPELLRGLAKESLRERVPYLGYLLGIAGDEGQDLELRRAAARCLGGATGLLSLELARKLCDHDALALDGLELLRSVCHEQPGRWFFIAFHPRPELRRAAYEGEVPPKAVRFDLPLLADEVLRPFALARLHEGNHLIDDASAPLAIDMLRDGLLPGELCLRMLRRNGFQGLKSELCRQRSEAAMDAYLKSGDLSAAARESDDLDAVFEVMPPNVETWAALARVMPDRVATAAAVRIAAGEADERWRTALVLALPSSLGTERWSREDER